jgi:predicted transport protein
MATDPEAQIATMSANLKANTGKSLEQWTNIARDSGKQKHGELVSWLKAQHKLTHGYANLVAHTTFKSDAASQTSAGTDLVAAMFEGDKASLKPIFDALLTAIRAFGSDIEEAPKKGYLSLRRKTQFATLHPSTKTRFDVGLKLKSVAPSGRLENAGSWNQMVTHRVRLESAQDVDRQLISWLRDAYDQT